MAVLVAVLLVVLAAGAYAAATLTLESDATELIDRDRQFLQNYDAYKAAYPQHWRLNIVVIDAPDARTASDAEAALLEGMAARPDLFDLVVAPGRNEFLARHALLYLPADRLTRIVDRLAGAQPALAALAGDPNLRGLETLFARAAGQEGPPGEELSRLAGLVADAAGAVLAAGGAGAERTGDVKPVSWAEVLLGPSLAPTRRIVVYQGGTDVDGEDVGLAPRQAAAVREIAAAIAPDGSGVTVRMTGRGPLAAAELKSALDSVQLAGLISLAFVVALLWAGFGSLRAIVAAIATLLVGLVITGAFAAVTVGTLNVLSMTFAVLFVGLGIDFAIHFILRLREEGEHAAGEQGAGASGRVDAWAAAARGCGPTLTLCALTTAIAFLSFGPTAYRGLAELGVISAGGMAIALAASFTVLPALMRVLGADRMVARQAAPLPGQARLGSFVRRHARAVAVAGLAIGLAAGVAGLRVPFDFNTLNMQDPEAEGVRTLLDLQADGTVTPYSLTIRVPDIAAAREAAERLAALDSVAEVETLADYVPEGQDEKLAMIDELSLLLGPPVLSPAPAPPLDDAGRTAALQGLVASAARLEAAGGGEAFARMASRLAAMAARPDAGALARDLERVLATDLVDALERLRTVLTAGTVSLETLPEELVARETGRDGTMRVAVLPREDLRDFKALGRFVDEVTALYPNVTGRPALEAGVGEVVVNAFRMALAISALAIFAVLVVVLRSPVQAGLVMAPLLLAAALTAATMIAVGLPLNVANVIVLPLLLGLGVDSGIHMMGRLRERGTVAGVFASSTPRAILVSALTTLGSFVALAFSSHRGMASMGTLLGIAIAWMLVCALVVLPALFAWYAERRRADGRADGRADDEPAGDGPGAGRGTVR